MSWVLKNGWMVLHSVKGDGGDFQARATVSADTEVKKHVLLREPLDSCLNIM